MVINLEIISKKLLDPLDQSGAQAFYVHKLMEFVIVSENKNLIFAAFQVVPPSFKNLNNSQ